jgi:hypothetical protein
MEGKAGVDKMVCRVVNWLEYSAVVVGLDWRLTSSFWDAEF